MIDGESAPVPTWLPRPDGIEMLRSPAPGRFAELCEAYRNDPRRRPPMGAWAAYGPPEAEIEVPRGYHRDLIVFRLTGDRPPLPIEFTSQVIAVWRKAILSVAEQPVAEAISGHAPRSTPDAPRPSERAHLALLPLADVGHRHARSHLLGLAGALPAGLSPDERRACLRALGHVGSLTLGRLGVWRIGRCDMEENRKALLPETWCRPARAWASVTPVVLGRYPRDPWGEEAAAMIREACAIAGLPQPAEVALAPVAWVLGVPPSHQFSALPARPGKARRFHVHARLVFPTPVAGPVLVGAGRHQGYGLFRQVSEDTK